MPDPTSRLRLRRRVSGPPVVFPLCGARDGPGGVSQPLHQRQLHAALLQTAAGQTHTAERPGDHRPRVTQEPRLDTVRSPPRRRCLTPCPVLFTSRGSLSCMICPQRERHHVGARSHVLRGAQRLRETLAARTQTQWPEHRSNRGEQKRVCEVRGPGRVPLCCSAQHICAYTLLASPGRLRLLTVCRFLFQTVRELEVYARYRGPVSGPAEGIY